jgi:hypothetical protein
MTKLKMNAIVFALIAMLFASSASACILKLSSGQESPQVGGTDVITLQFIQSHRNCTVKPEATEIKTSGMKIVASSEWKAVRNGVYERTFNIEYTESGLASFQAVRNCPKGGMTQELTVQVQ